ncbi:MAG: PAS domain S-box protein, partial [Rhodospirillales bacterium]|nr:PAS domain S-box protein [Rhodospirillales bacterium]
MNGESECDSEQRFSLSEDHLAQLITQAADAIISINADHNVILFNAAAERIFGYSRDEMIGANIARLLPTSAVDSHRKKIADFHKSGVGARLMGQRGEIQGRRKNGNTFAADASISLFETPDGPVYTAMIRDITDRKEAEKSYFEYRACFKAIVDLSPAKIHIKDLNGHYLLLNPQNLKILGAKNIDAGNQEFGSDAYDQFQEFLDDHDQEVLKTGGAVEREERIIYDDKEHVFLTTKFPIRDDTGNITSIGAIGSDVTERIMHRDYVEKHNQELEALNNDLSEFNYIASHDLQEPLRTLTSFSKLLIDDLGDDLPDVAREDIHFITEATERMHKLVVGLLDLSRINRDEIALDEVDLRNCLDNVCVSLKLAIDEAGATIEIGDLPSVTANEAQIASVLQNLVSNAIKFQNGRNPIVQVLAEDSGNYWEITVADNGIGIDAGQLNQIFAPFKR